MQPIFRKRRPDSHKGDYGHALIIAGSTGMTGAAFLACEAAILTGSGLVTCAIPKSLNEIMEIKLTEAMTLPAEDKKKGRFIPASFAAINAFSRKVDAAALGPGISQHAETKAFVKKIIECLDVPIVIDADGINCVSENPSILRRAKKDVVLTPHPGEMARLIRRDISFIQKNRARIASEFAKGYHVTVALKGHNTVIASSAGKIHINQTGNPGMASGGVGDVLTGIITSLLGQGFSAFDAAKAGVYLHGLAGDIAAKEKGQVSLRPQDILDNIHKAIQV